MSTPAPRTISSVAPWTVTVPYPWNLFRTAIRAATRPVTVHIDQDAKCASAATIKQTKTIGRFLLRDALLWGGILSTSATSPNAPSAWGFLLEHSLSLAQPNVPRHQVPHVRVTADAKNWDPRLRAAFSERIALGMCGLILSKYHNIVHFTDVRQFINAKQIESGPYSGLSLRQRRGKTKVPDFFCLDGNGEAVIAEAKGTIGTKSTLAPMMKKAKTKQLPAVAPRQVALRSKAGRIAVGTRLRIEGEACRSTTDDSTVQLLDPDGSDPLMVDVSPDQLIRASYQRCFMFFGRPELAAALDLTPSNRRTFAVSSLDVTHEFMQRRVVPLVDEPDLSILLDFEISQRLFNDDREIEKPDELEHQLRSFRAMRDSLANESDFFVTPNGFIVKMPVSDETPSDQNEG